jgi:hypothetical protein
MSFFSFLGMGSTVSDELPDIFPLGVLQKDFVEIDVENIYSKILTDVLERCQGLTEDEETLLWDSCLKSSKCEGLVTLIARAMSRKSDLYLVIKAGVLRKATAEESAKIKADYEKEAQSKEGVYISFARYTCTDMIRIYSALEYCTVASLNKSMNISKAVQIKIEQLRASVSLADSSVAKAQGQSIAKSLKAGNDVMLDAKDSIENATPDTSAAKTSMDLFNQKRAFYLKMPASYITGELNSGLGDSGNADARAVERGLKSYFVSIVNPVCKALFGKDLDFKSEDYSQIEQALATLKTFDITSDEYMSAENKTLVVNRMFGFDDDEPGGQPDPGLTPETSNPNQDPPATPPVANAGAY